MKFSSAVLASAIFFSASGSAIENNVNSLALDSPPPTMKPIPDFAAFENVNDKKNAFVAFMKPSIVYLNDAMDKSRTRLLALSSSVAFAENDKAFLRSIEMVFKLPIADTGVDKAWFTRALKRVDIIPVDLVLTQSAKESGWGDSRFAREGNNYYGQWCFTLGCGLIPRQRSPGKVHEVAAFKGPFQSTEAYFVNINTNSSFVGVRDIRQKLRAEGKEVTGAALANGLINYSQMGQTYVNEVQSMMRYNIPFWNQTK